MIRLLSITVLLLLSQITALPQSAKQSTLSEPGDDAHWPTAAKVGFGTANTIASKVWFTLADGVMTEAYYPRLDVPNSQCLQLIICTKTQCQTELDDMTHEVMVVNPRSLSFQQVNRSRNGAYRITKNYATDPARPTILIQVSISGTLDSSDRVFVYFDPSLNNSGMHDTAWSKRGVLYASDDDVATALIANPTFAEVANGYLGSSDGLTELKHSSRITVRDDQPMKGNVVQVGRVAPSNSFTVALGFGQKAEEALGNARASLLKGFSKTNQEYESTWQNYLTRLFVVDAKYQKQFNVAAMVLKGLEDKTYRGAIIASPSIPWGGGPNANEPTISGYHAVWSRDLYQIATALRAAGDKATANRALDYLFKVQQRSDGSFPQNTWVDGKTIGVGLQLDQVALPIVLAYQLGRGDRNTWISHIKPAADFIIRRGPATDQDRWEEERGYSPAAIAAAIAGLVCAARIAETNGDRSSTSEYLKVADEWEERIESWTATSTGQYGSGRHYIRISEQGNPDEATRIEINSGGGIYDQRQIVDAGFLELVRLGIRPADNLLIAKSLAVVDQIIKVQTPLGPAWYRYNHDAYGEQLNGKPYDGRTGKGRLWTLLTGERGEFELARGNVVEAKKLLTTFTGFANEGSMIPEQVWDLSSNQPGTGTGSATPLAWSMAQFIRLAINIQQRRNVETPDIVKRRYLRRSRISP